jgi:hypothetical protein
VTDPVLRLETSQLTVEPGGQVRAEFTVLNPGTIVESYSLDVVGEQPIPWAEVIPPVLSVYPQQQETATVVFTPPSGPTGPGGTVPFGIRAKSQVDPSASAVVEGEVEIGQVFGLQAKLTPVTSSGRWRGLHTIQFSNWGNAPARLRITASDPDQALGFLIRPEVVDLPLGATVTARVKVRTRKPVLRGSPTRLPFKVVGEPDPPRPLGAPTAPGVDPSRPVVDGALTQKPILSRGTVTAAVVVGAALIGVLAFALTRGGPATVPVGDGRTLPAKPTLIATAVSADTVELSWKSLQNIDSYGLLRVTADEKVEGTERGIDGRQELKKIDKLPADAQYCFKLFGVNGKLNGPPSDKACAHTPKGGVTSPPTSGPPSASASLSGAASATPSDSVTTTPSQPSASATTVAGGTAPFSPGDWIAAVELQPGSSPTAKQAAEDWLQQLVAAGIKAGLVHAVGNYPGIVGNGNKPLDDVWVVYVGPTQTAGGALAICTSAKVQQIDPTAVCKAYEPAKAPGG